MNEIQIKALLELMDEIHKLGMTILPKSTLEKLSKEDLEKLEKESIK